jgi:hypothetical protein
MHHAVLKIDADLRGIGLKVFSLKVGFHLPGFLSRMDADFGGTFFGKEILCCALDMLRYAVVEISAKDVLNAVVGVDHGKNHLLKIKMPRLRWEGHCDTFVWDAVGFGKGGEDF